MAHGHAGDVVLGKEFFGGVFEEAPRVDVGDPRGPDRPAGELDAGDVVEDRSEHLEGQYGVGGQFVGGAVRGDPGVEVWDGEGRDEVSEGDAEALVCDDVVSDEFADLVVEIVEHDEDGVEANVVEVLDGVVFDLQKPVFEHAQGRTMPEVVGHFVGYTIQSKNGEVWIRPRHGTERCPPGRPFW